jgi:hypothetical protein
MLSGAVRAAILRDAAKTPLLRMRGSLLQRSLSPVVIGMLAQHLTINETDS